jgi:hypothetical protein
MGFAIWRLVGREVRVLQSTAQAIALRTPESLDPIEPEAVPEEVQPLVDSIARAENNALRLKPEPTGGAYVPVKATEPTASDLANRSELRAWLLSKPRVNDPKSP